MRAFAKKPMKLSKKLDYNTKEKKYIHLQIDLDLFLGKRISIN